MSTSHDAEKIVLQAISRANDEMPGVDFTDITPSSSLYGKPDAILDSLNLVSFVFIIEEEFEKITSKPLKVSTQDVLDAQNPPFANIPSLKKFLANKIEGL